MLPVAAPKLGSSVARSSTDSGAPKPGTSTRNLARSCQILEFDDAPDRISPSTELTELADSLISMMHADRSIQRHLSQNNFIRAAHTILPASAAEPVIDEVRSLFDYCEYLKEGLGSGCADAFRRQFRRDASNDTELREFAAGMIAEKSQRLFKLLSPRELLRSELLRIANYFDDQVTPLGRDRAVARFVDLCADYVDASTTEEIKDILKLVSRAAKLLQLRHAIETRFFTELFAEDMGRQPASREELCSFARAHWAGGIARVHELIRAIPQGKLHAKSII